MTRKPDGWVRTNWREELKTLSQVKVKEHPVGQLTSPICLVPSALLDEIESFLTTVDARVFRKDWIEEQGRELLNKLREVRG